MVGEKVFIPNILLCGDEVEFISKVGNRLFKIVGYVKFSGEANGQKFDFAQDERFEVSLLDEPAGSRSRICEGTELTNMIRGGVLTI